MTRFLPHLLVGALVIAAAPLSNAAGGAEFVTLDIPGADATIPEGINDRGQIVGWYSDQTGYHGFLFSDGAYTTVDVPGATSTYATDINNRGDIVGSFYEPRRTRGFLSSGGTFTTIDLSHVEGLGASGINPQGEIVGVIELTRPYVGFVRGKDGTLRSVTLCWPVRPQCLAMQSWTSIADINARGQIVGRLGFSDVCCYGHAFMMVVDRPETLTLIDLPNVELTVPRGINAAGEIVGSYLAKEFQTPTRGFFRDANGNVASIDVPNAVETVAMGINARGTIVGYYVDTQHRRHGFVLE